MPISHYITLLSHTRAPHFKGWEMRAADSAANVMSRYTTTFTHIHTHTHTHTHTYTHTHTHTHTHDTHTHTRRHADTHTHTHTQTHTAGWLTLEWHACTPGTDRSHHLNLIVTVVHYYGVTFVTL
jgi:hypothetical protein